MIAPKVFGMSYHDMLMVVLLWLKISTLGQAILRDRIQSILVGGQNCLIRKRASDTETDIADLGHDTRLYHNLGCFGLLVLYIQHIPHVSDDDFRVACASKIALPTMPKAYAGTGPPRRHENAPRRRVDHSSADIL
jgi:hypothetical protein